MKKINPVISLFFILPVVLLFFANTSIAEVRIGVLAKRGATRVMDQWGATGEYLSNSINENVVIIPIKFTAIESMVKAGRIDFLLANSAFFVEMEKKYQIRAIVTIVNSVAGQPVNRFGGVLFVRNDSTVEKLADIRGKRFMVAKFSSFGGGQMAWRLLIENGIDPKQDTAAFLEGGTHDQVVKAVAGGVVDVGTVRSDTLERMASEGKIRMDTFRVINLMQDDFPFVHSTRLYPEWPLAALKHVPPALAKRVAKALQQMNNDSPAALAGNIKGWEKPADYSTVRDCLVRINYGIFAVSAPGTPP